MPTFNKLNSWFFLELKILILLFIFFVFYVLENKNYIAFDTETSVLNDSDQFIKISAKIEEITKITTKY